MNLRSQILLVMVILSILTLLLVTQTIRMAVTDRFTDLDSEHVAGQIRVVLETNSRGPALPAMQE